MPWRFKTATLVLLQGLGDVTLTQIREREMAEVFLAGHCLAEIVTATLTKGQQSRSSLLALLKVASLSLRSG
jgi:hypothetical protein